MKPENAEHIAALKRAIEWMESQGDALPTLNALTSFLLCPDSKDEARETVRAMGKTVKQFGDGTAYYKKSFGHGVEIDVVIDRAIVCRKIVTGTHVEPERVVEDVEWVCDESILAGASS